MNARNRLNARNRWNVSLVLCMAALVSTARSPLALGQSPPEQFPIIRINTTDNLCQNVLPAIWTDAGYGEWDFDAQTLQNDSMVVGVEGLCDATLTLFTSLDSTHISVPLDADSVQVSFKAATSGDGRVKCTLLLPDATLDSGLFVMTGAVADCILPDEWLGFVGLADHFSVTATGLTVDLDVTLEHNDGLKVKTVHEFKVRIGSIEIEDTSFLIQVADFYAGVAHFFGLSSGDNFSKCATSVVNGVLGTSFMFKNDVKAIVNEALAEHTELLGYSATLPCTDNVKMAIGCHLDYLWSSSSQFIAGWNFKTLQAVNGIDPGFPYSPLSRPAEDFKYNTPKGDMQVFVPLMMIDRFGYELCRGGVFTKTFAVTLPDPIKQKFAMTVKPRGCPRATADATSHKRITLAMPIEFGGTSSSGAKLAGSADLSITFDFGVHSNRKLYARPVRATLANLRGEVTYLGVRRDLAPYARDIENGMASDLLSRIREITLIPAVTTVSDSVQLVLTSLSVGTRYIDFGLKFQVAE